MLSGVMSESSNMRFQQSVNFFCTVLTRRMLPHNGVIDIQLFHFLVYADLEARFAISKIYEFATVDFFRKSSA